MLNRRQALKTLAVGGSIAYRVDVVNHTGMGGIAIGPNVCFGRMRGEGGSHDHGCGAAVLANCQICKITPLIHFHCFSLQLILVFTAVCATNG